jgi:nucleotide-binding universal stress UspA family protein
LSDERDEIARTIIIGLDRGEQGPDALALGGALAEALAATPLVATVVPHPRDLIGASELERALEVDTDDLFAVAREELAALAPRTRAIGSTSPAGALYQLAEDEGAVAIVVGSTHRGALGRAMPGSVGANLLRGAPCAVAVAPRNYAARDERRLQRLLVGFDGSPEANAALDTAAALTTQVHGTLTLVTVAEPPGYGWGEALSVLSADAFHSREQRQKRDVLDLGLDRVPDGVAVEGRLVNGEVADVLADASKDFDLLLLGSRGYGPLRRTLLGSAAGEVMTRAACPVLILPRTAGVKPLESTRIA